MNYKRIIAPRRSRPGEPRDGAHAYLRGTRAILLISSIRSSNIYKRISKRVNTYRLPPASLQSRERIYPNGQTQSTQDPLPASSAQDRHEGCGDRVSGKRIARTGSDRQASGEEIGCIPVSRGSPADHPPEAIELEWLATERASTDKAWNILASSEPVNRRKPLHLLNENLQRRNEKREIEMS